MSASESTFPPNSSSNATVVPSVSSSMSSSSSCTAFGRSVVRTEAVVFFNTRPILRSHNLYRFGYSSNITAAIVPPTTLVLVNGSSPPSYVATPSYAERRSYVVGLISVPLAMFCLFGLWLLLLGAFRCRPKTFGFLSGRKIVLPRRPTVTIRGSSAIHQQDPATSLAKSDPNHGEPAAAEHENLLKNEDSDSDACDGEASSPAELPVIFPNESRPVESTPADDTVTNLNNPQASLVAPSASQRTTSSQLPDPEARAAPDGPWRASESLAEEKHQLKNWRRTVRAREIRMARIRIAVLVSGLTIIIMAILLIAYGVQNLSESVSDSLHGLDSALALCDAALILLDRYVSLRNDTLAVTQTAIVSTNYTVCPQIEQRLCGGSSCTDVLYQVVDALSRSNYIFDSIVNVRNDVVNIQGILASTKSTIVSFNWAFWIAAAAVALLAVCTLILMNSVVLAWRHKQLSGGCWYRWTSRFRGYVVVPVFVVLLVLGWVFSMVFVIGSIASADFCYNSPDTNVLAVLESLQSKFSSFLYPLIVYYVSGCPNVDVVEANVLPVADVTLQVLAVADAVLANVTVAVPAISALCGTDPTSLRLLLTEVSQMLCLTANTVLDTLDFFTCSNWNQLYASLAYSSVCWNGNAGFGWVAITQSVILVSSLVMLTLRVAFYELVDEAEDDVCHPSACKQCLCWKSGWLCCVIPRRKTHEETTDAAKSLPETEEAPATPSEGLVIEPSTMHTFTPETQSDVGHVGDARSRSTENEGESVKAYSLFTGSQASKDPSDSDSQ